MSCPNGRDKCASNVGREISPSSRPPDAIATPGRSGELPNSRSISLVNTSGSMVASYIGRPAREVSDVREQSHGRSRSADKSCCGKCRGELDVIVLPSRNAGNSPVGLCNRKPILESVQIQRILCEFSESSNDQFGRAQLDRLHQNVQLASLSDGRMCSRRSSPDWLMAPITDELSRHRMAVPPCSSMLS